MPAGRQYLHLGSRPETIHWGYLDAALAPVLRIRPGDVVTIDTLSHQGLINGTDPATFFGSYGVPRGAVLKDAIDVYAAKQPEPGYGVHVLTGPVYVEGAEPGDVLEVRVLDSHALRATRGMSAADAYTLCSVAADFEIAEAVNVTKVVHGRIPKAIFKQVPPYWAD
jgi:acetamidase/formamidase